MHYAMQVYVMSSGYLLIVNKLIHSNFISFLLYRLSSVIIIQTSYVPDEYWQCLEIAHNMAFGYGYLTWEWKQGLRSYIYPLFFSIFYKLLKLFYLDFSFLLIFLPKIAQAFLTALSDHHFLLLCRHFGFQDYWTKAVIFTNWFWYYCGFRTITNTFETSFTTIALYYYPWSLFTKEKKKTKSLKVMEVEIKEKTLKYLSLAAINCIVRPTAVTIWGPLIIFQIFVTQFKHIKEFFLNCILPISLIFVLSLVIDFTYYGKFIIPSYNFLVYNIFQEISSFYGTHPFHWYLTQGLPVVLGLHYLPFLYAFILLLRKQFKKFNNPSKNIYAIWLFIFIFNILILSKIPHKEFRFILPLTPLMMILVVKFSSDFFTPSKTKLKYLWTFILVVGFLIPCLLFGTVHQIGPLKLMAYLRNSVINCKSNCFILFLMPCHSTPLYSHLHVNISTKFLTCEPPIMKNHFDESEIFFSNPLEWLINYWDSKNIPSHITFFDDIDALLSSFLEQKGFIKKKKFLHTLFKKNNSGRYILVYEPS